MKYLYLGCFLILFHSGFAQIESGEILYRISFERNEDGETDSSADDFMRKMTKNASKLKFRLIFDQKQSLFLLVEDLSINESDMTTQIAKKVFGGNSVFYTDVSKKISTEKKEFLGESFLITNSLDEKKWVLTNETKIISGYECFKAVGRRQSVDRDFNVTEIKTYAWYCPELPLNFGPFEAVGLPGLVLEFNLKGHSFVVEKITFDKSVKILKPEKGKLISQKEFQKIIQKKALKSLGN